LKRQVNGLSIEKVWANFKNILRRIRHKYSDFKDAIKAAWNWNKTLSD
jgi:hypothetical protein